MVTHSKSRADRAKHGKGQGYYRQPKLPEIFPLNNANCKANITNTICISYKKKLKLNYYKDKMENSNNKCKKVLHLKGLKEKLVLLLLIIRCTCK